MEDAVVPAMTVGATDNRFLWGRAVSRPTASSPACSARKTRRVPRQQRVPDRRQPEYGLRADVRSGPADVRVALTLVSSYPSLAISLTREYTPASPRDWRFASRPVHSKESASSTLASTSPAQWRRCSSPTRAPTLSASNRPAARASIRRRTRPTTAASARLSSTSKTRGARNRAEPGRGCGHPHRELPGRA